VDERCLPAWTRRRVSDGRDVRTERSVRRLSTVREDDTVIGIVSPETFLMKICMVSVGSGETDRDDGVEERIFEDLGVRDCCCLTVRETML